MYHFCIMNAHYMLYTFILVHDIIIDFKKNLQRIRCDAHHTLGYF